MDELALFIDKTNKELGIRLEVADQCLTDLRPIYQRLYEMESLLAATTFGAGTHHERNHL